MGLRVPGCGGVKWVVALEMAPVGYDSPELTELCAILKRALSRRIMFITLEGGEGSGKTSQIKKIENYFNGRGFETMVTREPGDTPIGKKIRAILLDPESRDLTPMAELMLYAADRAQHVEERILPALADGKVVICDRFFDATTVYQGAARGIDMDVIRRLHKIVLGALKPDLTLLLDVDPEVGLSRAWKDVEGGRRDNSESRFEMEALAFHHKVRQGYLDLAAEESERFQVVDAGRNAGEVEQAILAILKKRIA